MPHSILNATDFSRALKKEIHGVYLFFGEEAYLKHHALRTVREKVLLDPSLAVFNHIVLKEEDATPANLMQAVTTPPVMADQKLIEVHSLALSTLPEEEFSAWEQALEDADSPDVIVIFYAEAHEMSSPAKAGEVPKDLLRYCELWQPVFFPAQSRIQLAKWVVRHLQEAQISCTPDFPDALLDYCGADMSSLINEIQKIIAYLRFHKKNEVDKQMISLLCAPHPTRDPFDFTNAILDANTKKAFAIFAEMKAKKEKPELILGSISRVICDLAKIKIYTSAGYSQSDISALTKMHAYRVGLYAKQSQHRSNAQLKRAVRLCAKTDAKMKRAVTDPYLLLERLIVELSVPVTQGR